MAEATRIETRWTCLKPGCGASNRVSYASGSSVYEVVELIRADHAADSPSCETDLTAIRVEPVEPAAVPRD